MTVTNLPFIKKQSTLFQFPRQFNQYHLRNYRQKLWLGTDNGVFIYNQVKDTFTPFVKQTSDKTSITSWITHIIQDKAGNIWIATHKQGIFLFNTQTDKLTQFEIPQNDNIVTRILNDEQNNIWLSGPYQLCKLNKVNNTFETYAIEEKTESIYSMALWKTVPTTSG